MDIAYDHVQEETLPSAQEGQQNASADTSTTLNTEFQQAFKAVSASPWGARLGGLFASAKKQGETFYSDAQKEYANRSEQAVKGLGELQKSLANTTRNIAIDANANNANTSFSDPTFSLPESSTESKGKEQEKEKEVDVGAERPDSLPADIMKEATNIFSRLRLDAAARLKNVQKAEDAADEALLKFGSNIRNFLRDAVTVTAPSADSESKEVLFETNDAEGKRVIHSSRFDAQLHVIHSSAQSFMQDPDSAEYDGFAKGFDVQAKTDAIAQDLEKYPELRRAMEKLVPESVEYGVFWSRYYFLRKVIQEEEQRRREVLKGAAQEADEEIAWGSDDSDDEDKATTPTTQKTNPPAPVTSAESNTAQVKSKETLAPRRSNEEDGKSVSSSDASYDIVSGATSRTPGSPKEEKETVKKIEEESDEDDWE